MSGQLENNRIQGLLLNDLKRPAGKQPAGETLNSEILKNSSGSKKKSGSGRVAGTRQTLPKTDKKRKNT